MVEVGRLGVGVGVGGVRGSRVVRGVAAVPPHPDPVPPPPPLFTWPAPITHPA